MAGPGQASSVRAERLRLGRQWDEALERARAVEGFADFLRPARVKTLLPAASGGPIVVPVVSTRRCDALVVTADGVEVVRLPGLTAEETVERANRYVRTVLAMQKADEDFFHAKRRFAAGDRGPADFQAHHQARTELAGARARTEDVLDSTARWLWDAFADPVLTALGLTGSISDEGGRPRLWWCPTGPMTLLPLHAAGHHDRGGPTVLDRVVSSYTPTLRVLLDDARDEETWHGPGGGDRLLLVSVPEAGGQPPLPDADGERELLTGSFPADRVTCLAGAEATRARVLRELNRHRWVHFSCHGDQDLGAPASGGLIVHDGRITVAELGSGSRDGEFAFLSACKTATGGVALPNEAMSLAAALRYSGYRHVLATLWSVYDTVAARIAADVYTELLASGRFRPETAATALDRAVRRLRERDPRPSAWTPFAHFGP
ncbi:CHAT domain-containing protein [Actinomadura syzygii]|uniref:CHAT domain-containing protein n=1 Tax=Actinomadura syzygii TaxID=1427538 RepID=UPI001651BD3D|nr:CHAT domain-containing protein [Actinomadura syzygii]